MTQRKPEKKQPELTADSAAYWACKFILDTQQGKSKDAVEAQENLKQLGFTIGRTQGA